MVVPFVGGGFSWYHLARMVSRVYAPPRERVELHAATQQIDSLDMEDPWAVLGLPQTADRAMIKSQYKKLAREYHPDLKGACASQTMMQRIISATETILAGLKVEPAIPEPEKASPRSPTISRVEKMWRQREIEKAEADLAEVLLYTGQSRVHRAQYCVYRILRSRIEMRWALARYMDKRRYKGGLRTLWFQDIRRISSQVDQEDNLVDLELELIIGSRFTLEQLPQEVAKQVVSLVKLAQFHRQVMREKRFGTL